ncbi:MAG: hypothetical protein IJ705_09545 [Oscillospiraceae bacterium]|nr:hypothetical protein [Oscillospiraceae bacterium]
MSKDFQDFLEYVRSPEGDEEALSGIPELFRPDRLRDLDYRSPDGVARLAMNLFRASEQNTLNLLRMYHDWLNGV